jgi:hypothetical protein
MDHDRRTVWVAARSWAVVTDSDVCDVDLSHVARVPDPLYINHLLGYLHRHTPNRFRF